MTSGPLYLGPSYLGPSCLGPSYLGPSSQPKQASRSEQRTWTLRPRRQSFVVEREVVRTVLLLWLALAACVTQPAAEIATVAEANSGQPLEFEFPGVGGEGSVGSATTRGRATVLAFVATYDIASQAALRNLGEVIVGFTPRANAAAVVVEPPRYAELLPAYRDALGLPFPVVMADFATQQGQGAFGSIERVPVLVVLDRAGREVWREQGAVKAADIEAALRRASRR